MPVVRLTPGGGTACEDAAPADVVVAAAFAFVVLLALSLPAPVLSLSLSLWFEPIALAPLDIFVDREPVPLLPLPLTASDLLSSWLGLVFGAMVTGGPFRVPPGRGWFSGVREVRVDELSCRPGR